VRHLNVLPSLAALPTLDRVILYEFTRSNRQTFWEGGRDPDPASKRTSTEGKFRPRALPSDQPTVIACTSPRGQSEAVRAMAGHAAGLIFFNFKRDTVGEQTTEDFDFALRGPLWETRAPHHVSPCSERRSGCSDDPMRGLCVGVHAFDDEPHGMLQKQQTRRLSDSSYN
jgi:hypothetical protein